MESRSEMKILSKDHARDLLSGTPLETFIAQLFGELRLVRGTYSAPNASGVQIALSKLFAFLLLEGSQVCLCITGWGIGTEHLDLFYGYRRSHGEKRPLIEAPVHMFERADEDVFISILCMVFFFSWDASIFDISGKFLLQTSHDGWLEFRTNDGALFRDVPVELENYKILPLVG